MRQDPMNPFPGVAQDGSVDEPADFGLDTGYASHLFGLITEIPEGAEIPAWHGIWRFDYGTSRASTAIVGLNLLLALVFRLLGWVKHGGLRVSADPRQAFVDGLNAGHEAAVNELPDELRELREMTLAKAEAADKALQHYGPLLRLRNDFTSFLANLEQLKAGQIPQSDEENLIQHLQSVAKLLRQRMDTAYKVAQESGGNHTAF